ncbi:hypothetical protein D3C84_838160 [compost metagenome]
MSGASSEGTGGLTNHAKGAAQGREIVLALRGEAEAARAADEQLHAQGRFQFLDLQADRTGGDAQLAGGKGDTDMPGSGFEGAQGAE